MISSDAGGLLLREVEKRFGILKRFAACFRDYRDPERIEHSVETLISQRVYGIALGYEDLNDHDSLRHDVVMGVMCEKSDPSGMERARKRDQGKAVAGKSTLNRLELTPEDANEKSRYKKIVADGEQIEDLIVDVYIETESSAPQQVVLDVDATDDHYLWESRGAFFSWVLRRLLLSAAVYILWGVSCCVRGLEWPVKIRRAACARNWNGSSRSYGRRGRRCESSCAGTRAFAATRS